VIYILIWIVASITVAIIAGKFIALGMNEPAEIGSIGKNK
jgi:hypothetical protein